MTKVLFLSDRISAFYNDSQCASKIRELASILGYSLGMSDSLLKDLIDNVGDRTLKIFSCFDIPVSDKRQFTQLVQEANAELSKLNFSYETLLAELRQEKCNTEKLAQELREANNRLWDTSFRDELTGLHNRRYLFDFLGSEISRFERFGSCFSLLLLDIDHFKKVNDAYGHRAGDLVLQEVGSTVTASTRRSDIVVRYGGEEFIVVLPETGLEGALIIAEQLRKSVAAIEVAVNDQRVRVTISIGVAACHKQKALKSVDSLIEAADEALYMAKASGRNRVFAAMAKLDIVE